MGDGLGNGDGWMEPWWRAWCGRGRVVWSEAPGARKYWDQDLNYLTYYPPRRASMHNKDQKVHGVRAYSVLPPPYLSVPVSGWAVDVQGR